MARKPNYAFERNTRAKAKAEKREAKRQAKLAAKTEGPTDDTEANGADSDDGPVTETPRPD
jgi:hypothetical protein